MARTPATSAPGRPAADVELVTAGASPTQSLDRAMELLDLVVAHAVDGISLGIQARRAGLSKPTAHRLLAGLRNAGVVDYDAAQRLFFPAFKLHRMGLASGARFDVVRLAGPSLERLAEETGDTVYLAIRNGDFAVCAARCLGAFPIRTLTLDVGDVRPLGLGSNGVVLLAAQTPDECERISARHTEAMSAYPAFAPAALQVLIAKARHDGHAVNQGQMLPDTGAVAMGIRSPAGSVGASISVAAITSRMQSPRLDLIVKVLREEIVGIESLMAAQPGARRAA